MTHPTCSIPDCDKAPTYGRERHCSMHRARIRRHGDPSVNLRPLNLPLVERFHRGYIEADNGCWVWKSIFRGSQGYGRFGMRSGPPQWAHRVGYELLVGPIPKGLELDHLCRNPACVNPDHLEPVTHRENVMRGARWNLHLTRQADPTRKD